jgi:hypothetical protein
MTGSPDVPLDQLCHAPVSAVFLMYGFLWRRSPWRHMSGYARSRFISRAPGGASFAARLFIAVQQHFGMKRDTSEI